MLVCKDFNNVIRWQRGERLDHLFEQQCDYLEKSGHKNHPAVITEQAVLTYRDLDNRANQVARYLIKIGIRAGDRVGLLFNKSIERYIALLAVLKVNAAYVPLDAGFPSDRISFIASDADVRAIVTLSMFQNHLSDIDVPLICLDDSEKTIATEKETRLSETEKNAPVDQLSYIIYTSGTTGNPKGVAIDHPSICNFVRVAGEVYGLKKEDRMYQGMTIAFDFSVEEIWVPLIAGATLVPGRQDSNLVGAELADFLIENQVTAICCVPTLLATIEADLPALRFLLVSGEACPHDLVVRWHRPGRTFLNAYGPTEATVTATWTSLHPEKPVTIGGPLPTYSIVILEENQNKTVKKGELGEICIAGIGLANGYLNRPDLTEKHFINDFLNIENNPSQRIYRTGDLGRVNNEDQIEYQGRIDTQVKIRGYRIELTEIESVLLQVPQIAQAVVNTYEPEPGAMELVAYYSPVQGVADIEHGKISDVLRGQLPSYMVPAFIEKISSIPMLSSNKADRKNLPDPTGTRLLLTKNEFIPPETKTEKLVASALVEVLKIEQVSVEDHFFDDLGAHSLLMAQFSAKIKKKGSCTNVSMRDIYLHPTVRQLAEYIDSVPQTTPSLTEEQSYRIPKVREYYTCGVLQFLFYISTIIFDLWVLSRWHHWVTNSVNAVDAYIRIVSFAVLLFSVSTAIPIALKWILIGKWKTTKFPIWSLKYFRFWIVKQLLFANPIVLFKGTEFFNIYLRLLGAKIGRNVVIQSKYVPLCTDLISIGDNSILHKDSILLGYKAESGYIRTGPTTIGRNTFIGDATVLDINTVMEDDTQLGHTSSLQEYQTIPKGKRYHGSPAEETQADYCTIKSKPCSTLRRFAYPTAELLSSLFVFLPIPLLAAYYYLDSSKSVDTTYEQISTWLSMGYLMGYSLASYFGSLLFGLLTIVTIPRLLNMLIKEEKTYVLYGIHYFIFTLIFKISNSKVLNYIFGDSSFIVYYLKAIGYNLGNVKQTGSNFGLLQKHDNPLLCNVGRGTFVSDGFSIMNAEFSNSSFKLCKTTIGENNFLGNNIHYPPDGKTGKNCLLATKVMIPVDGEIRENVGLLGSPCFEIPRSVRRDRFVEQYEDESLLGERIRKKNWSNFITISIYLFSQWLIVYVAFLSSLFEFNLILKITVIGVFMFFFSIGYFILVERMSLRFKRLKPQFCSIYDPYYWKHERYWKLAVSPLEVLFRGTPFKNIINRMLGIKVGKMVFDEGARISEKTLTEIGDYCTINESTAIQAHSLEDGVFKSDHIKIGAGCTIGINAFVHYGVKMGDNVILDTDSFLMKGEAPEPNSKWRGNPARLIGGN